MTAGPFASTDPQYLAALRRIRLSLGMADPLAAGAAAPPAPHDARPAIAFDYEDIGRRLREIEFAKLPPMVEAEGGA